MLSLVALVSLNIFQFITCTYLIEMLMFLSQVKRDGSDVLCLSYASSGAFWETVHQIHHSESSLLL